MDKDDGIAGLAPLDSAGVDVTKIDIGQGIADRPHLPVRGRHDGHTLGHDRQIRDPEVGAAVPVIGQPATGIVPHAWPGVVIEIVLYNTTPTNIAVDRKRQGWRRRLADRRCCGPQN